MSTTSPPRARPPHPTENPRSGPQDDGPAAVHGAWVLRGRRWSLRAEPRTVIVCTALIVLTAVVGTVAVSVGDLDIPLSDVLLAVLGRAEGDAAFAIGSLRLPRVLTGVCAGAALGMSGAIFQSLTRNPLGSPEIVGFTQGAALGAVAVVVLAGGSGFAVAAGTVVGGLVAAALVVGLSWASGLHAHRLILVGIGVGFTANAGIEYLLARGQVYEVQRALTWITGSLNGRGWDDVRVVAVGLLVCGTTAVLLGGRLHALELGDDTAAALGLRVTRSKIALVTTGVGLCAFAVAAAGPILFVPFVSGPIGRRLTGSPGAALVAAAATGAALTTVADLVARTAFSTELPVGVATAAIGAPYLLWLLTRQIRTGAL